MCMPTRPNVCATVSLLVAAVCCISFNGATGRWPRHLGDNVLSAASAPQAVIRRVNVPDLTGQSFAPAIFWLGQVGPAANYADVRVWHNQSYLKFAVHITDRLLWYNGAARNEGLTNWDAVSLYIETAGAGGQVPATTDYWFVNQLMTGSAAFRGDGTGWTSAALAFTPTTAWRGNGPNDTTFDNGWVAVFEIPFATLGLAAPPASGTTWRLGVVVHDRDDAAGTPIPGQLWPEALEKSVPSTWGELRFGRPVYTPPTTAVAGTTLVRQGLNDAVVPDAAVGGHSECGGGMNSWTEWGNANYAGYTQFNIQNQWDIADFPCFSKYYVTFPLNGLPAAKTIVSAKVRLTLFGNAGYQPGDAQPSAINALTVLEDWAEATITWNNAPRAAENVSVTWVNPVDADHPAGPYEWDVSRAAADAYARGEPLRLAFYSTDGDYHSGKYFWSSDVDNWGATTRPTLEVRWANATAPGAATSLRIIREP